MINCILLTRDRPKLLRQALVTLYDTTPLDAFNLVIVDDGTAHLDALLTIDSYANKPNCSVLYIANGNHVLAAAKNLGVQWSQARFGRGDYLLLLDNDCCFMPGWYNRMAAAVANSKWIPPLVLGGARHPFHQPISVNHSWMNNERGWIQVDAVAGTSQMMKWDTWDTYGPLEGNAPGTCQSEDFAFCQKITKAGRRVGYVNSPCILDCGITQTDGKPSPGADVKPRQTGVYFE